MICPVCGGKLRPNKGWAAKFYDGYCNTCDVPVVDGVMDDEDEQIEGEVGVYCNPNVCPYCQDIGEGDSWCEETGEIVLEDWEPTEDYMGSGCPFQGGIE